ncbi:MAG: enoyl-[acyl-carrier-protein] reductase [Candidatus Sericytochromatia bacterium]|nr:enoyl-[acyl-carrier-protein] reductase [Candidatus Tanganyikabacteria bacterium]
MLSLDLRGRHALVAGVADDHGYGFAIARALAAAGATVSVATWPPALGIFRKLLERGKLDGSRCLPDGSLLTFAGIHPLDAAWDHWDDVPDSVREDRRYREHGDFTVNGLAQAWGEAHEGRGPDILVHALANGPEVRKALVDTSRQGYLTAVGVSAYSLISMARAFGPTMPQGGALLTLSYLAAERAIPGYGGGMSSAKAALESDTRTLAWDIGRRWGLRVNALSAGPLASRAASAIGIIEQMIAHAAETTPIPGPLAAEEVAHAAAFLCSPLASGITGTVLHVDRGYHAMGLAPVADTESEGGQDQTGARPA